MNLIDSLIRNEWLKTEGIIEAFRKIKRIDFLPVDKRDFAELNTAIPIGHKATISQPLVVAFMLELLQPEKGEKILDIGSGSGWTTALLAEIVGEKGKVIGLEIIPELVAFGKNNILKYNFTNIEIKLGNGRKGDKENSPFDKILVSAETEGLLPSWRKQLKEKGKIVASINNTICLFKKEKGEKITVEEHKGFTFVPLIKK